MTRTVLLILGVLLAVPSRAAPQSLTETEGDVARAAGDFVAAFNNLDWERFEAAWAEDATAFMPVPEHPALLSGRDTIVRVFKSIFGDFPERFEGPPYLSIQPVDLDVDVAGSAAVVSFHLGDEPPRDRRTLVFVLRDDIWRIKHLHASDPPD